IKYGHSFVASDKIRIPVGGAAPSVVLHKFIVGAEIHCHWSAADRAVRNQLRRDPHFFLPFYHQENGFSVVIGFLAAGPCALPQTVISLRIEETLFVKS